MESLYTLHFHLFCESYSLHPAIDLVMYWSQFSNTLTCLLFKKWTKNVKSLKETQNSDPPAIGSASPQQWPHPVVWWVPKMLVFKLVWQWCGYSIQLHERLNSQKASVGVGLEKVISSLILWRYRPCKYSVEIVRWISFTATYLVNLHAAVQYYCTCMHCVHT